MKTKCLLRQTPFNYSIEAEITVVIILISQISRNVTSYLRLFTSKKERFILTYNFWGFNLWSLGLWQNKDAHLRSGKRKTTKHKQTNKINQKTSAAQYTSKHIPLIWGFPIKPFLDFNSATLRTRLLTHEPLGDIQIQTFTVTWCLQFLYLNFKNYCKML